MKKLFQLKLTRVIKAVPTIAICSLISLLSINLYASTISKAFDSGDYASVQTQIKSENDHVREYYLGRIAFNQGELDTAEIHLEEAVNLAPDVADYHYWWGMVNVAQINDASIFSKRSYATIGKESYHQAIKIDPNHLNALTALTEFYTNAPSLVGGSFEKAHRLLKQLYRVDLLQGMIIHINLLQKEGKPGEALEMASQLVEKFADSVDAQLKAGFIFQNAKHYEQAFNVFDSATKITSTPHNRKNKQQALYQLGKTSAISGKFAMRGIQALTKYIDTPYMAGLPDIAWAKYRLAMVYHNQGNAGSANKLLVSLVNEQDSNLQKQAKSLQKTIKRELR